MKEYIKTNAEFCTGCNRCVRECPMETANITYQDETGSIKVRPDHEKCIVCGRCVSACKHKARHYADDTERFFEDLSGGAQVSLIAAPSIRTNIPEYKRLFTYLKQLGVNKIYDASLGADICVWAHIRHLGKDGFAPVITQPCPVVVEYCELYRHDLIDRLSPVHSPMACTSVYLKEYRQCGDDIAALSPCIAKSVEFDETGLAKYNVTFARLLEYLEEKEIALPCEETGFDHTESGLGSLFPMPGGLKENIEYFIGKKLQVTRAEGFTVYDKLNKYAETEDDLLPDIFDVLNCIEGCNMGSACSHGLNVFEIEKTMDKRRRKATEERKREYYDAVYKTYDDTLDLSRFTRTYKPDFTPFPDITEEDIEKAFILLGKTDKEKQNVDCGACGSATCHNMARKIALNVNIPINCIVKSMEDARIEHEQNTLAHEQITKMEKIHEADERMRIILDASPHINTLFDSDLNVVDCNPAAYAFMGFKTKEEFHDGFFERVEKNTPETLSDGTPAIAFADMLAATLKEGHTKFETEVYKDGKRRAISVEMKKVPYEDSFGVVVNVVDMTDIRERENELLLTREENELQLTKLHMVVQATKIGLWEMEIVKDDPVNPKNEFTWSDEFRYMLGYEDQNDFPDLLSSWSDCIHPDDKERIMDLFERHIMDSSGKTPYDVEYRMFKKNGECSYYRDCGETIWDEDGSPIRVAGALLDVSETRNLIHEAERQRREAEAANKAKTSFLSTMSHEIRTPMNAILGITEIQLQNEALAPGVREGLEKVYTSGDLLLGIINDILDLSKIEAGKLEFLIGKYDIASLISDTAQLNIMRIGSKPIEFEIEIDENTPVQISGDELRVKQILNNLLSNAFKYTLEGKVRLSVGVDTGYGNENEVMLVIVVSDTGQGMTGEQLDQLFDEFARFNTETNRTTEGTGLGMSITNNLIHLMNGEIFVESEPGKGSVFTVRLPQGRVGDSVLGRDMADNLRRFRTSNRSHMKRVQITREPMPYGSVLIVDDVETNIYVAKGLMAPYGLKIDSADSGAAAIGKIKKNNVYDIIFMDHMMPNMDGIEATNIIRDMGYSHPIVALTANAVAGQADMFLENGFNDFISKPIDIRQLNTVLNRLVRDKQTRDVIEAARASAYAKEAQSADDPEAPAIDPNFAEIFVRDALKALAALEGILQKNDYDDGENVRSYIINVHGMKSALANVGQKGLSDMALQLETAAREGKFQSIASETPAFLRSLNDFVKEITPVQKTATDENTAADEKYLTEKLLVIKTACEEYDEKTADETIRDLRERIWSSATAETLNKIAEHLLHSDFDEIIEIIEIRLRPQ